MLRSVPAQDLLDGVGKLKWGLWVPIIDEMTLRESKSDSSISVHLRDEDLTLHFPSREQDLQFVVGAANCEMGDFVRITNFDYPTVHAAFTASYPSVASAERVLDIYNILPASSERELFDGLVKFISDTTVVHPTHRAADILARQRGENAAAKGLDPARVGVHTFHLECGNPFVGPNHGVAHHAVDVIYIFDTFHDALERADKGFLEGYQEPGQKPSGAAKAVCDADHLEKFGRSNVQLTEDIQDMFIQFIVEDTTESERRSNADAITTYGRDRAKRIESWSKTCKWAKRRQKYNLLEEDSDSLQRAIRRLVGDVLKANLAAT